MQLTAVNTKLSMKITANKLLIQDLEIKTSKKGNVFATGFMCEVIFSKKKNQEFTTNFINFVCFEPNVYNNLRVGSTFQLLDGDYNIESYQDRNGNWQNSNKIILNNVQPNGDAFHLVKDKFAQKHGISNQGQQQYAQPQQQYTQPQQYAQPQQQQPQQQPQYQQPAPQGQMPGFGAPAGYQEPSAYPAQAAPATPQAVGFMPQAPTMGNYQ